MSTVPQPAVRVGRYSQLTRTQIPAEGEELGALAQRAGVTKQAMSQLVAKGYVERREDPNDRRSRIVVLTEKGMDAIRSARHHIAAIERDYRHVLGSERFEANVRRSSVSVRAGASPKLTVAEARTSTAAHGRHIRCKSGLTW